MVTPAAKTRATPKIPPAAVSTSSPPGPCSALHSATVATTAVTSAKATSSRTGRGRLPRVQSSAREAVTTDSVQCTAMINGSHSTGPRHTPLPNGTPTAANSARPKKWNDHRV
ncbi:hypothetical protein RKD18_004160 [Streptomyces phaeoluteigriseus]